MCRRFDSGSAHEKTPHSCGVFVAPVPHPRAARRGAAQACPSPGLAKSVARMESLAWRDGVPLRVEAVGASDIIGAMLKPLDAAEAGRAVPLPTVAGAGGAEGTAVD